MKRKVLPPPRFVYLETIKRCNLHCTHCDYWQRRDDDKKNYLSFERKLGILDEFAALNPEGNLVICGGEPMLEIDEYFDLCRACRDRGLRCLSVVNGTQIRSAEIAEKMIIEGPHEISISLDSSIESLHDESRGTPGAFKRAVRALRLLVEAKKKLGAEDTRIYVMALVFRGNYRDIDGFLDFVLNDIGADQLKLNIIQPSFGLLGEVDTFFSAESDIDADEIERIIQSCDRKYGLALNPEWIRQVGMYFRSLSRMSDRNRGWNTRLGTRDLICNSYERNVMIDIYGVARLCFSPAFPEKVLRKDGAFTNFWRQSDSIRARMRRCNRLCGISHSVRRESSTLKGRAKMLAYQNAYGRFDPPGMVTEVLERFRELVR